MDAVGEICYQCGQVCENDVTYCHACYDHRSQSDFQNEQRWRAATEDLQNLRNEKSAIQTAVGAFRSMLLNAVHTDVTIETGDADSTPAHRAVLASRSPVFAAMFEHELREKNSAVIRVADVPTPAMRAMLLFLYTGELDTKVMKEHGISLLAAAHKYDIPDLKKICETSIAVQPSNAMEFLQQARLYDANLFKKACVDCIATNIGQLAFTEDFRGFVLRNEDPEALLDIFQSIANASPSVASTLSRPQ